MHRNKKRGFILDVSTLTAGSSTISLLIDTTDVFETNGTFGDVTIANTNNLTSIINQLKTTAAISRAADLGATLDVYVGANSEMPSVTLKTGSTSSANFEGWTDAQIAALVTAGVKINSNGAMVAKVTTYDQFTYTVGGNAVTASITLASGVTSATGSAATAAVASAIAAAWNAKYGQSAGASKTLSFWSDTEADVSSGTIGRLTLASAQSGSRAYGQGISFSHSYKATGAQVSLATAGVATTAITWIDYIIGSDDAQLASTDNKATDVDLIITLEETLASGTAIKGTAMTVTLNSAETPLTELITLKRKVGAQSNTTATDIYENDPGIYTSIGGGNAGDVRAEEDASEGLVVEDGSRRAYFTRIHWLG